MHPDSRGVFPLFGFRGASPECICICIVIDVITGQDDHICFVPIQYANIFIYYSRSLLTQFCFTWNLSRNSLEGKSRNSKFKTNSKSTKSFCNLRAVSNIKRNLSRPIDCTQSRYHRIKAAHALFAWTKRWCHFLFLNHLWHVTRSWFYIVMMW